MIHRSARQCPHCGFALQDLDAQYGASEVMMRRLSDAAGVLKLPERKKAEKWFDRFETSFPQLFFSVYYGALDDVSNIRQFGMWLLNRGAYEDVDLSRPNDGGILLVVDVNSKTAFIAYGYLLDFHLTDKDTFSILSKAHPHLLKGAHSKALKIIVTQLSSLLRRRSRKANRNPAKYQKLAGCFPQENHQLLQPLRAEAAADDVDSLIEEPEVEKEMMR
jgi:hypothetical protein